MSHRFNYTGRTKITGDKFTIRLHEARDGEPATFTADVSGLTELKLDPAAKIIIEPYVRQSSMRFDFGTIGSIKPPADTTLFDVDAGANIQFRVKVVDVSERPGRLIAIASNAKALNEAPDNDRKSILEVKETDLGEAIWEIDVTADAPPCLKLNKNIPGLLSRLQEDPILRGAILSVAVKEVLEIVLDDETNNEQEWVVEWREFATGLLGEPLPDAFVKTSDDYDAMIQSMAGAYASRERWATEAKPKAESEVLGYE